MTILITRPRHDEANNYLYHWSQPVIDSIKRKRVRLADLTEDKACNRLLWQYSKKLKPALYFFNGHGSPRIIAGHNDEVLISADDDLAIFGGSVFYSRSCDSAAELGPAAVKKGVKTFVGYIRKFSFGYMSQYSTQPLRDPLAKLFLEPSNLIVTSLVKGNTVYDASRKSLSSMKSNFSRMLSSTATFEERYFSYFLWSNIKNQVVIGEKMTTIKP